MTPVTITLRQGISSNLDTLYDLTNTTIGGQYIWTPAADLPNGSDYALQITQGNQTNYYGPFRVQGYTGPLSSSSVATMPATMSGNVSTAAPGTGTISMGTASPMPRNTTFSSATLAATTTTTVVMPTGTSSAQTSTPATTGGAGGRGDISSIFAVLLAFGALLVP
ncbi:hypothetical protein AMS68_002472 [Peltaster fructicola]|uniref:Yeast cell wall synthesis Kre9/Knh1-like N-terminal domain-containing protein n=1 Tax=Peltaster fructicola TaxID=286661 RepID=A0A6H0XQP5_9PEZI|nr:hypothetical protein AMS68_002472 [Peltaster fructicola]